jgi:hypothetical protein
VTLIALQILQSTVVLVFAPFYAGVLARAVALTQSQHGPSVLQPLRANMSETRVPPEFRVEGAREMSREVAERRCEDRGQRR